MSKAMTRASLLLATLALYGLGVLGGVVFERKAHHCPRPVTAEDFRP